MLYSTRFVLFLTVFVILNIFTTSIYASEEKYTLCRNLQTLAEAIAIKRYEGVPMHVLMDRINESEEPGNASKTIINEFSRKMIIIAYELPNYQSEELQRETINNFRDTNYLECVKGLINR